MRAFFTGAVALVIAISGSLSMAGNPDRTAKFRQLFVAAAAETDATRYAARRRELDDYILAPYLDYARLRRDIRNVDADDARRFLEAESTTQLGEQFRSEYLAELARRRAWPEFVAFDRGLTGAGVALRCHRVRALLATGRGEAARQEFLAIWPTGSSLPDACDIPVAEARNRGWLGSELLWKRLRLAVEMRNAGLATYLARQLPADERADAERLARATADPEASLKAAAGWPDGPRYREAASRALELRARADVASAIGHWRQLAPRFAFAPDERAAILHDLALYAAVDYRADAEDWFLRVPVEARSEQLADWQLRAALAAEDWAAVLKIADGLPAPLAAEARTRYWRARALDETRRGADARAGYAALALEANFHGFLAADRLTMPYTICPKEIVPDPGRTAVLRSRLDVARALELHAIGWRVEANRAWEHARQAVGDADRLQMVLLASEQGWHDRAVFTLNSGDDLRHYSLRFPVAERETVLRESAANGLEPAWAYALIRAESAWQPDARSPANAYGLMQLLPSTGQRMARQLGMNWRGPRTLLDPEKNIRLGTRYLAQQAEQFEGSPWLASAAYNAGPRPVRRWLNERESLPADVFIETIPYRETREYVARVLAFSVIYDWRLNGTARPLSDRLPDPGQRYVGSGKAPGGGAPRPVVCPAGGSSAPG
jgi:soluble lytic murein transglycosylase